MYVCMYACMHACMHAYLKVPEYINRQLQFTVIVVIVQMEDELILVVCFCQQCCMLLPTVLHVVASSVFVAVRQVKMFVVTERRQITSPDW